MATPTAAPELQMGQTIEHEGEVKRIKRITYNTKDGSSTPFKYHIYFDNAPQIRDVKPKQQFSVLNDNEIASLTDG